MTGSARRKPIAAWAVRIGMVVIVRTNSGQRIAFRVDSITDLPRVDDRGPMLDLHGPGVYVGDPDRWRVDGRRHRIIVSPASQLTRVLPVGHPDAT